MVELIRKSLSTGKLKVSSAQLQSKLCLVGCGVDPKYIKGIIERYSNMSQHCPLDDFDVYVDETINAIIYEAIKEFLFNLNIYKEYSDDDISEMFWLSFGMASKITREVKDLWSVNCQIVEVVSSENDEDDQIYYQKDYVEGNIIVGILIFLLSNAEYPNAKRFTKDLIRMEKSHLEQPDSFLPYLWTAFIEYGGERLNKQMDDTIPSKSYEVAQVLPQEEVVEMEHTEKSQDDIIKEAISQLITEQFGDNKIEFKKANWYAVYRVYENKFHQDISYTEFSNLMKKMGLTKVAIDNDISKAHKYVNLPKYLYQWSDFRYEASQAEKRQIDVALRLKELLKDVTSA